MTMRVTRIADAEPFNPVGHDGVGPVRLQGGASTPQQTSPSRCPITCPARTAQLAPQEAETVYVVLSGQLVMASDGVEEILGAYDSVHFTTGTLRTVENRHEPAGQHARHRATR